MELTFSEKFSPTIILLSIILALGLGSCSGMSRALSNSYAHPTVLPDATSLPPNTGNPPGPDRTDVLILYDSLHPTIFATNLCLLASYYGLTCQKVDLTTTDLTATLLHDHAGRYFKLVGLSADSLVSSETPAILSASELVMLHSAVENGANLLVSNLHTEQPSTNLSTLTGGVLSVVEYLPGERIAWAVSASDPQITLQFTGQVINTAASSQQRDYALRLDKSDQAMVLVSSRDAAAHDYPVFVKVPLGAGAIFADSATPLASLEQKPLREQYYDPNNFASLFPLMATLRYALGVEAWHNPHSYANLQIDDPSLTNPYKRLNYPELLSEMERHNFHTTIAMLPKDWDKAEPRVVDLVGRHPERFSIVPHGNNHDGYEFFKYELAADDPRKDNNHYARPLADQAADLRESLQRMKAFNQRTGLPWERVMVFPWGISPEPTLQLLKQSNYLGTVNLQDAPLAASRPSKWDYGMYPVILDYANFPLVTRRPPGAYQPFRPDLQPFLFDLFVNKPALFYSHAWQGEIFDSGIEGFNPVADQLNRVSGGVEWRSLGFILSHLWLEKCEDDGSQSVQFYTKELVFINETGVENSFHFSKDETLNVPIQQVTVNGYPFPYRIEAGALRLDLMLAAEEQITIRIQYGD